MAQLNDFLLVIQKQDSVAAGVEEQMLPGILFFFHFVAVETSQSRRGKCGTKFQAFQRGKRNSARTQPPNEYTKRAAGIFERKSDNTRHFSMCPGNGGFTANDRSRFKGFAPDIRERFAE